MQLQMKYIKHKLSGNKQTTYVCMKTMHLCKYMSSLIKVCRTPTSLNAGCTLSQDCGGPGKPRLVIRRFYLKVFRSTWRSCNCQSSKQAAPCQLPCTQCVISKGALVNRANNCPENTQCWNVVTCRHLPPADASPLA